jgi:hypothetical protein
MVVGNYTIDLNKLKGNQKQYVTKKW